MPVLFDFTWIALNEVEAALSVLLVSVVREIGRRIYLEGRAHSVYAILHVEVVVKDASTIDDLEVSRSDVPLHRFVLEVRRENCLLKLGDCLLVETHLKDVRLQALHVAIVTENIEVVLKDVLPKAHSKSLTDLTLTLSATQV